MITAILSCAVVAVIVAYVAGYLVACRSAPSVQTVVDACNEKLDAEVTRRLAAEQEAQMWRGRADRFEKRLQQLDRDVTASTEMLLAEIDQAAGVDVCEHGKRAGCDWCDQPAPYALASRRSI